jgi:hypothetical protein
LKKLNFEVDWLGIYGAQTKDQERLSNEESAGDVTAVISDGSGVVESALPWNYSAEGIF